MSIKAVLFDIDDTLYDRAAAQKAVLEKIVRRFPEMFHGTAIERVRWAFTESDRVVTADFNAGAPSTGLRDARSRLFLKLLGFPDDNASEIGEMYVRDYPSINVPVAGAVKTVTNLSRTFKVGAISNGLPDVQYRKLETIGVHHLLSCVVLSEELGIRKPEAGIFLHAVEILKVPPGECLFVGDSYSVDVIGAKRVGMKTCWYNPGHSPQDNKDIKADFIIFSLAELLEIIR